MVEYDADREEGLVQCSMVRRSIIGLSVKLLVIFFTLTKGRKFWITMDGFLGPVLDRDFLEFRLDWMVLWPHGLYFPFLHHVPNFFFLLQLFV